YAYATANDPLIESFEDFISYTHVAMGFCFFFYVLINFTQPLQKGLEVHKVIYKPKFYELLLFRMAAAILVFMLISFKNYNNYFQTKAGYYNAIADYYTATEDFQAAETFYKEALHFDIRNHKSNYALASLALKNGDKENTGIFLKNALEKNASPFAYAGLSKVLQEKDMFFDALFTLREGVSKFPQNQQLLTNIAYLYEKTKVLDSTFVHLNLAKTNCTDCDLAESNLLAYQLKYGEKDSLYKILIASNPKLGGDNRATKSMSLRANRAAADKILQQQATTNIEFTKDSAINVSQFALLYNLSSFNNAMFPYSSKDLQNIQRKEANNDFFEDLEFAIASRNYFSENKLEGMKQLAVLANDSTKHKPLYNQVAGMWFLQQGVYDKSVEFLGKAGDVSSVEVLQKQNYQQTIAKFQKAKAEELFKTASTKKADFDKILQENPLNPYVLNKVTDFYNNTLKKPNDAYNFVFRAAELNDTSAEIWKLYTLQSLKIGLTDYVADGLAKVQQLSTPADYQAFFSTYQAQKALMEKTKDGFE
ncbi:MAG: tetratricopeptide repeat protein, partial [Emticicia sp.]